MDYALLRVFESPCKETQHVLMPKHLHCEEWIDHKYFFRRFQLGSASAVALAGWCRLFEKTLREQIGLAAIGIRMLEGQYCFIVLAFKEWRKHLILQLFCVL